MQLNARKYYFYQSLLNQGKHVRKMRRTELSCDKIFVGSRPSTQNYCKRISRDRNSQKKKLSTSIPKLQNSLKVLPEKNRKTQSPVKYSRQDVSAHQYFVKSNKSSASKPSTRQKQVKNNSIQQQKFPQYIGEKKLRSNKQYYNIQKPANTEQELKRIQSFKNAEQQYDIAHQNRDIPKSSQVQGLSQSQAKRNLQKHYFSSNTSEKFKNPKKKSKNLQSSIHNESVEAYFTDQLSQIKFKDNFEKSLRNSNKILASLSSQKESVISSFDKDNKKEKDKNNIQIKNSEKQGQISKLNNISIFDSSVKIEKSIPPLNLHCLQEHSQSSLVQNKKQKRYSFKHLPLSSREPSRRSIRQSLDRPIPNCFQDMLQRIEIHQHILALLLDFKSQTAQIYQNDPQKYQILCFLLEKKYFYECSNMVKALKGGKNVFCISSIQIPTPLLKQHQKNPKILQIIKEEQQKNITLFKALKNHYIELKKRYKNQIHLKIQSPNDDFTVQIVRLLNQELFQLYEQLLSSQLSEENSNFKSIRIIEIMEKVFLLSQISGKKVRKIQFAEQIEDFQLYYEKNLPKFISVIEYFES